ncbi:MAG: aspartate/glutamate racemase family protein [Trueperaceae bacterium]|nr:aspartate/glutamate racemase family protein [Trueperaceae bacterium]
MKTLGLLGGMSWESTALYYRRINEAVRARLGGLHSARIVMVSVDFAPIEALQAAGDWDEAGRVLAGEARRLEAAGAEATLLCTNTMHRVAGAIETATQVPLLHIADATAARIRAAGARRVGLLGTRFTMEQDFYRGRLQDRHDLEVLVPDAHDRALLHDIIFGELCLGQVRDASRREVARMVDDLAARGAEGVIEGCTEITMLELGQLSDVPRFDTTALHAEAAVAWALDGSLEGPVGGAVDSAAGGAEDAGSAPAR